MTNIIKENNNELNMSDVKLYSEYAFDTYSGSTSEIIENKYNSLEDDIVRINQELDLNGQPIENGGNIEYSMYYDESEKEFVIAFQGTVSNVDWINNLAGAVDNFEHQREIIKENFENFKQGHINKAKEYDNTLTDDDFKVTTVGHSQGGAYAELFHMAEPLSNEVYTYNGLGTSHAFKDNPNFDVEKYNTEKGNAYHISSSKDLVSMISAHQIGSHYFFDIETSNLTEPLSFFDYHKMGFFKSMLNSSDLNNSEALVNEYFNINGYYNGFSAYIKTLITNNNDVNNVTELLNEDPLSILGAFFSDLTLALNKSEESLVDNNFDVFIDIFKFMDKASQNNISKLIIDYPLINNILESKSVEEAWFNIKTLFSETILTTFKVFTDIPESALISISNILIDTLVKNVSDISDYIKHFTNPEESTISDYFGSLKKEVGIQFDGIELNADNIDVFFRADENLGNIIEEIIINMIGENSQKNLNTLKDGINLLIEKTNYFYENSNIDPITQNILNETFSEYMNTKKDYFFSDFIKEYKLDDKTEQKEFLSAEAYNDYIDKIENDFFNIINSNNYYWNFQLGMKRFKDGIISFLEDPNISEATSDYEYINSLGHFVNQHRISVQQKMEDFYYDQISDLNDEDHIKVKHIHYQFKKSLYLYLNGSSEVEIEDQIGQNINVDFKGNETKKLLSYMYELIETKIKDVNDADYDDILTVIQDINLDRYKKDFLAVISIIEHDIEELFDYFSKEMKKVVDNSDEINDGIRIDENGDGEFDNDDPLLVEDINNDGIIDLENEIITEEDLYNKDTDNNGIVDVDGLLVWYDKDNDNKIDEGEIMTAEEAHYQYLNLKYDIIDNSNSDGSFIGTESGRTEDITPEGGVTSIEELEGTLSASRKIDPIVFDLNGDGVQTIDISEGVYFDHEGDGFSESTGWISQHDGFLVNDLNGNGKIDNGGELFGDKTVTGYDSEGNPIFANNGFASLEQYDSNNDGIINKDDEKWNDLKIWQDINSDGISQEHELKQLEDFNIESISLNSETSNKNTGNGNEIGLEGNYKKTDGTLGEAANINFETDDTDGLFNSELELENETKKLPNSEQLGLARNLHEAMTLSDELKELVESYSSTLSKNERSNLLDKILFSWASTSLYDDYYDRYKEEFSDEFGIVNGNEINELDKIAIAEIFSGSLIFDKTPKHANLFDFSSIDDYYSDLKDYLYKTLSYENIEPYEKYIELIKDDKKELIDLEDILINTNNKEDAALLSFDLKMYYSDTLKDWDIVDFITNKLYPDSDFSENVLEILENINIFSLKEGVIDFELSQDIIDGVDFKINKNKQSEYYKIIGNDLNNNINDSDYHDIIQGGVGDDHIISEKGNDTFIYNLGDGNDYIEISKKENNNDKIILGKNIEFHNLSFVRENNNIIITINAGEESEGTITLSDAFDDNGILKKIDSLVFDNGLKINWDLIVNLSVVDYFNGDELNNYIYGDTLNNLINGFEGDDRLYGKEGDDILNGGTGDDLLYDGYGDDISIGGDGDDYFYDGEGRDILDGGTGNDTFYADLQGSDYEDALFIDNGNTYIGGKGNDVINDTYHSDNIIYNLGDGHDIINLNDYTGEVDSNINKDLLSKRHDILIFGEGITLEDLTFMESSDNLIIKIAENTLQEGSITLNDWFDSINSNLQKIEEFKFSNGETYTWEEIQDIAMKSILKGSDENDSIIGFDNIDQSITGGKGDDTINDSENSNNIIEGNEGDDTIIVGGSNTAIIYNLGDGNDEIDISNTNNKNIELNFGVGIYQEDLSFELVNNDLIISVKEGSGISGEIKINGFYYNFLDDYRKEHLDKINFYDGSSLDINDINIIIQEKINTENPKIVFSDNVINDSESDDIDGLRDHNNIITAGDGDNDLFGNNGDDILNGGDGNDYLRGGYGSDILNGGDGDDYLIEGDNNSNNDYEDLFNDIGDVFNGGKGDDTIYDSNNSDTIIYNLGDGNDTFNLNSNNKLNENIKGIARNEDKLIFGEGININDLSYSRNYNNLIITIKEGTENQGSLTFKGWFDNNDNLNAIIESFLFEDGTSLSAEEISKIALTTITENGSSNDVFYDLYNAHDLFIYNIGDGNDIIDLSSESKFNDSILFGEGITFNDLYINKDNDNLEIILFKDTTEESSIIVKNYYRNDDSSYKIENFNFHNGDSFSWEEIFNIGYENSLIGSDNNDYIYGNDNDNIVKGNGGNDNIYGEEGNDSLEGGEGADRIRGNEGNDFIEGNNGNDYLYGNEGNDKLYGGDGDDDLRGGYGKDFLNGGNGNDTLGESNDTGGSSDISSWVDNGNVYIGGEGDDIIMDSEHSDTIIYNLGDGNDQIYLSTAEENLSNDGKSLRKDKILFGENISIDDVSFHKNYSHLEIKIKEGTEFEGSITLNYWFSDEESSSKKVELFEFSNGEFYSWEDINNHINGIIDITTQYDLLAQAMSSFGSENEDTVNETNQLELNSNFIQYMD